MHRFPTLVLMYTLSVRHVHFNAQVPNPSPDVHCLSGTFILMHRFLALVLMYTPSILHIHFNAQVPNPHPVHSVCPAHSFLPLLHRFPTLVFEYPLSFTFNAQVPMP